MTGKPANHDDAGTSDVFHALQAELTVALIATERCRLMTCAPDEPLPDVMAQNDGRYDFLPVVASGDGPQGRIIGLFHAAPFFGEDPCDGHIEQHYAPLSEEHLIGADASILAFIKNAGKRPYQLVVSGPDIVGLVSLSDLQKLPARAALFAMITDFEISMSKTIKRGYQGGNDWKQDLDSKRQKLIVKEIERSHKGNGFVDELLFTQFRDKAEILSKGFDLPISNGSFQVKLARIKRLRNRLAHANEYAASSCQAQRVCAVVRDLLTLRDVIATLERRSSNVSGSGAVQQEAT